ncbi:hypothetical protein HUT18_22745 [Streptomyces sp. NA04227]|uniref:hypothetical protein n=1 Tax=Streptomyces sp. NA04227 TaxID=2742136 RepID=UPI0015903F20|nr:hypothetical protein [Streptomyces sp. NA04227]QKW08773.1 hypothetical protein HUT18_22745 [Streptomyces sp. NA04227]
MRRDFSLSGRSWLLILLLLAVLAALLVPWPDVEGRLRAALPDDDDATRGPAAADRPLPGGGTAVLSRCGERGTPRPSPRGTGEREELPALVPGGHGYRDPGPRGKGRARFTLGLSLAPGSSPLALRAPVAGGGFTVEVYSAHDFRLLAAVRGLSADVVEGPEDKLVRVPRSGRFTFTEKQRLGLRLELPRAAVCPGHDFADLMASDPVHSNDTQDYPVFVVTMTDPALREHRARVLGTSPRGVSDRLVWVSWEPEAGEAV